MIYILMHKDFPIIGLDISDNGNIERVSKSIKNNGHLPLMYQYRGDGVQKWWNERCLPKNKYVENILLDNGLSCPAEYLVKNLGLSLTDHYWIKPMGSDLAWSDVNLFTNDFKNELLLKSEEASNSIPSYSPNSSLQGNVEKSWNILDGERVLIKGNHEDKSLEAMNEVIASKIHELQGFSNYADYKLIKIHDKPYEYGCYSKLFTNEDMELISAHELLSSQKGQNDISAYEQLIKMASDYGLQEERVRSQLEYQILTDFIMSNTDRHLNNIAFLANDEHKIIKMAPIFDTGKSLFVDQSNYHDVKELLSIKVQSFKTDEIKLLKYVRDKNAVDLTKLPPVSFIKDLYEKDDKISRQHIVHVCEAYEKKIDLCRDFQLGKDLHQIKICVR